LKGEKGVNLTVNFTIKEEVLDCAGFSASFSKVSDVSTCGGNDGSATVSVTASTGAATYKWSHGAATATAGNLSAGDYTVTVSDAQDCSTTLSVTIENPSLPTVTLAPFIPVKETDTAFALSGGGTCGRYLWGWCSKPRNV
jgi:hypothetical protein